MVQPTRKDQHSSGHGFVLDLRPTHSWALGVGDIFDGTHQVLGARINELDSTRILGCLDVVNAAPDAARMDMSPVRATRWIDDRPHGADSQLIGFVISELAAHHGRDRVDVLNQSRKRDVLVQLDVAVPTPQLREVRLAHPCCVAFSFGVDRLDQVGVQNLAVRNFQRKNERRKIAFHLERVFGQTSHQAAVRGSTCHFISLSSCCGTSPADIAVPAGVFTSSPCPCSAESRPKAIKTIALTKKINRCKYLMISFPRKGGNSKGILGSDCYIQL